MSTTIAAQAPLTLASLGGHTMGTTWSVKLTAPRGTDLHSLHTGIQARLDRVVAQMSPWEQDSDISRYNRAAAGTWHILPGEFFTVLACGLEIASASAGAFDPGIGALVNLWGFGPGGDGGHMPDLHALQAARTQSGWQRLQLDHASRRVLQPGALHLDLSAIAKGYGVDAVAACLRLAHIGSALVDVGGELYGYGRKPDGSRWRVLVESAPGILDPDPCVLALDGLAVATSGDRWHHFVHQGRRYSHTLDPRNGQPVDNAPAAVSVVAADAMRADAWATALTVMGVEAGLAFADTRGLAARFVSGPPDAIRYESSAAFRALAAA